MDPSPPLQRWRARLKPFFSAGAFLGGFLWDALTLGRDLQPRSLWLLLGYYLAAGIILVLLGREVRFKFSERLNWGLQFCFGSLFNALVIFYFLSSSHWPGYLLVLLLAALQVGNEFLEKHYGRLTLSWALFCLCGAMFLNFALPELSRSLSPIWFYAGTGLSLALTCVLRALTPRDKGRLWPALAAALALLALFQLNAIPPVPLAKRTMAICRGLERQGPAFVGAVEVPDHWWDLFKASDRVVHHRPGEKIFCFTSVFVPRGIECPLYHHWMRYDSATGAWQEAGAVRFTIRGGRKEGFRGFTFKQYLRPGRWKVQAETEGGQIVGLVRFRVRDAAPGDSAQGFKRVELR